jgi:nodulation protein E
VLGHSLGAAGALEAAIAVLALREQILPPTANCTEPDHDLGIDMIPEGPRRAAFDAALSNSFAFGGLNAVLVLGRV